MIPRERGRGGGAWLAAATALVACWLAFLAWLAWHR